MSENNLYYIYIDSKIEGTIDQLMSYFQTDVFNTQDCICVYFKFYKDIENYIKKKFETAGIPFNFIRKNSDLKFESHKTVFYLFNAQSNCKITARRDLTHIFVSHGESHKLASIKPIFRIYDFVITSGQVGIERFLKAGIFNLCNIEQEFRVMKMGDTFIGQNPYVYSSESQSLLYAPTWEGGVPFENYSSIGEKATKILIDIIQKNNIHQLYIQPHPNLGHRDREYIRCFKIMIKALKKLPIKLVIIKPNICFADHLNYKGCAFLMQHTQEAIMVSAAVVDISAMEMQLVNKNIPTLVLFEDKALESLIIPKKVEYLYDVSRSLIYLDAINFDFQQHFEEIKKHQDYLIGYEQDNLRDLSFRQRIQWLCTFATKMKSKLNHMYADIY